ncbi:MAG: T9SS type A sorting domain-containing protein, partial [Candidatus Kapabacteria bacterium]|nr:T9SS type A sorting domain-containing protein [Candidatus Kapabacteria bacterium]
TQVVLQSPHKDSLVQETKVQCVWDTLYNADSYQIQVSENPDMTIILRDSTLSANSLNVSSLKPNKYYYWHVRGVNSVGEGDWSETWRFITGVSTDIQHEEYNDDYITITPQPSTDWITITTPFHNITRVTICNVSGIELLDETSSVLNVTSLPQGMYICRIYTNTHNTIHKKLLVIR